eukprot:3298753-Alexandrium_andersonii.AAC.1
MPRGAHGLESLMPRWGPNIIEHDSWRPPPSPYQPLHIKAGLGRVILSGLSPQRIPRIAYCELRVDFAEP